MIKPLSIALGTLTGVVIFGLIYLIVTLIFPDNLDKNLSLAQTSTPIPAHIISELTNPSRDLDIDAETTTVIDIFAASESEFELVRNLLNAVANASEETLARFISESQDVSTVGNELQENYNPAFMHELYGYGAISLPVIFDRLIDQNEKLAVQYYHELDEQFKFLVTYSVFHNLALEHFHDAVDSVRQQSEPERNFEATQAIIDAHKDLPDEKLIDLGNTLNNLSHSEQVRRIKLFEQDKADPESAWTTIKKNVITAEISDEDFERLVNIALAWVSQSGLSVMDSILEKIEDERFKQTMLRRVLALHSTKDPKMAFVFALEQDQQYWEFVNLVLLNWLKQDPEAAWVEVLGIESNAIRFQIQENLIWHWASLDPTSLFFAIEQFPEELYKQVIHAAFYSLSETSIDDAIQVLHGISDEHWLKQATKTVIQQWMVRDPRAAVDWLQTAPTIDSIRYELVLDVISQYSYAYPRQVFELARSIPIEKNQTGLEAYVIRYLVNEHPRLARELLIQVRSGSTKALAYQTVGIQLGYNGQVDEAIALGNELPSNNQDEYHTLLGITLLSRNFDNENDLFDILDRLPSKTARSKTALNFILTKVRFYPNKISELLAEDQILKLQEYLTPEDNEALTNSLEDNNNGKPTGKFLGF